MDNAHEVNMLILFYAGPMVGLATFALFLYNDVFTRRDHQ